MKKFEFRLETVLKVREQEESVKRKELMEEELVLRHIERDVRLLQEENDDIENGIRQGGAVNSADELASHLAYLYSLKERMIATQDSLLRQKNVTEYKRREVAEAQKKKKMIENLKEKSYREWKEEGEREQTKQLDEIATLRHTRKDNRL